MRAGAIIALGPVKQYVSEPTKETIVLKVYAGAHGESLLYADDGESFAYERGELMLIKALWNDGTRELTLSLARGSKVWEGYRNIAVEICPGSGSQHVTFGGTPVTVRIP